MENQFMFAEKMGKVLFNPTSDPLDMQYSGVSFTLNPGEKATFEDNAADHLLNSFGQRGLSYLKYGSDEKQVAEEGKQRNYEFKKRMVTDFNVRNENRKVQGLGYLVPSAVLKSYASQLRIELMEPYAARDEEKQKIQSQEATIAALQATLASLMAKIDLLASDKPKTEVKSEFLCDVCGKYFAHLGALNGHKRSHERKDVRTGDNASL